MINLSFPQHILWEKYGNLPATFDVSFISYQFQHIYNNKKYSEFPQNYLFQILPEFQKFRLSFLVQFNLRRRSTARLVKSLPKILQLSGTGFSGRFKLPKVEKKTESKKASAVKKVVSKKPKKPTTAKKNTLQKQKLAKSKAKK